MSIKKKVSILLEGKKIIVVPAYNAEKTVQKTYNDIPKTIVDEVLVEGSMPFSLQQR